MRRHRHFICEPEGPVFLELVVHAGLDRVIADIALRRSAVRTEAADVVGPCVIILNATREVVGDLLLDAGTNQPAGLPAIRTFSAAIVA